MRSSPSDLGCGAKSWYALAWTTTLVAGSGAVIRKPCLEARTGWTRSLVILDVKRLRESPDNLPAALRIRVRARILNELQHPVAFHRRIVEPGAAPSGCARKVLVGLPLDTSAARRRRHRVAGPRLVGVGRDPRPRADLERAVWRWHGSGRCRAWEFPAPRQPPMHHDDLRERPSVKGKEPDLVRKPDHRRVIARHDDAKQRDDIGISERQCQELDHRCRARRAERRGDVRGGPDRHARHADDLADDRWA